MPWSTAPLPQELLRPAKLLLLLLLLPPSQQPPPPPPPPRMPKTSKHQVEEG